MTANARLFLTIIMVLCASANQLVRAQSGAPKDVIITDERLFQKEKAEPLSVWNDAAADGSRKAIELKGVGGVALRGWAFEPSDPNVPFVLSFHGSSETIADAYSESRGAFFSTRLNLNVIAFDYRGTGFSEGNISLEDTLADALAIYDSVVIRAAGQRIFVCGRSLGSIFASHVAASRSSLAGLILLAPIASKDWILNRYGPDSKVTLPASFSLIQSAAELEKYHNPLLVVHGTADLVVPIMQGRRDFKSAASLDKTFVAVKGKGHSATIWSIEADDAISAFMIKHGAMGRPPN
jgi:pimeloyl-ACP methyl ester carboxylesterase